MTRAARLASLLLAALALFAACGEPQNPDPVKPDPPVPPVPDPKPSDFYSDFLIPSSEEDGKARAFPGAEGCGMFATGGRSGNVYHVTNLQDSGSGSLRYGIENASRPCVIVFDVAGEIPLVSDLKVKKGDVTIAGQTAPGDGICLRDHTFNIQAGNVVVRFLRCRMGDVKQSENDAMNSYYNNTHSSGWSGIIVDHCSLSWCTDECGSFYGSANSTLQWCILSESLTNSLHGKGAHGYGGIWGGQNASFHHNLLADHTNRTPRLCGSRYSNEASKEKVELINNVIFNWTGEGAYGGEGGSYNLIGNYYKPGPASAAKGTHCRFFTPYADDGTNNQAAGTCGKFFLSGNVIDGSVPGLSQNQKTEIANANTDNFAATAFTPKSGTTPQSDFKASSRFDISYSGSTVTTQEAYKAFDSVLSLAGASVSRDAVDTRIVSEVRSGTCSYTGSKSGLKGIIDSQTDVGGWPAYSATAEQISKVKDSDGDGMPDWFEDKFYLKKSDPSDGSKKDIDKNGRYTNLEMYLHYLVKDIVKAQK